MSCGTSNWKTFKATVEVLFKDVKCHPASVEGMAAILCRAEAKKELARLHRKALAWVKKYKCRRPTCRPIPGRIWRSLGAPRLNKSGTGYEMTPSVSVAATCLSPAKYKKWLLKQAQKKKIKISIARVPSLSAVEWKEIIANPDIVRSARYEVAEEILETSYTLADLQKSGFIDEGYVNLENELE